MKFLLIPNLHLVKDDWVADLRAFAYLNGSANSTLRNLALLSDLNISWDVRIQTDAFSIRRESLMIGFLLVAIFLDDVLEFVEVVEWSVFFKAKQVVFQSNQPLSILVSLQVVTQWLQFPNSHW